MLTASVVCAFGLAAAPAHADTGIIGGCPDIGCTGTGFAYSQDAGGVNLHVDCAPGTLTIDTSASAQAGYPTGQWVTYRTFMVNLGTSESFVSPWSAATVAPSQAPVLGATVQTPRTNLPLTAYTAPNSTWTVQAQYAWHDGSDWVFSGWLSPAGYSRSGGDLTYYVDCYT